jgi:inhibitor of cysteine peptidase
MKAAIWLMIGFLACHAVTANEAPAPTPVSQPPASGSAIMEQDLQYVNPREVVTVTVGRRFSLVLASNPTTGYQWQLAAAPDPAIATLVTNEYLPPAGALIGAGGDEKWTFRAVGAGRATISLIYVRPWEKDAEPARRETFTVEVR